MATQVMSGRGFRTALMLLALAIAGTARADLAENEPLPQTRWIYVRGMFGLGYYNRVDGYQQNGYGFGSDFGAEIGSRVLEFTGSSELSGVAIGLHVDHLNVNLVEFPVSQDFILGQLLVDKSGEWGAYFGPEFGIRNISAEAGGSLGSALVIGLVGGVEIPLTTHLTYGPHFEGLYATQAVVGTTLTGTEVEDAAAIFKFYLALSYHL